MEKAMRDMKEEQAAEEANKKEVIMGRMPKLDIEGKERSEYRTGWVDEWMYLWTYAWARHPGQRKKWVDACVGGYMPKLEISGSSLASRHRG